MRKRVIRLRNMFQRILTNIAAPVTAIMAMTTPMTAIAVIQLPEDGAGGVGPGDSFQWA